MIGTIDMAFETHHFFFYLSSTGKRIYLIPSTIGEDISIPMHKLMQTSCLLQYRSSRAQVEMVGITKDDLSVDIITQLWHMYRLDRAYCPDGHEDRGKDLPVVGLYTPSARGSLSTSLMDIEFQHRCR